MRTSTLAIRDLALQILAQESRPERVPEDLMLKAQSVFERLRVHLMTFVGAAGYRSMLSRALVLAKSEAQSLGQVTVSLDGTLDLTTYRYNHASEGTIVLLAQLLGLVETLVGEALMLHLVQEVWPMVTLDLSLNTQQVNREVIP
jgi:hypothetical protein